MNQRDPFTRLWYRLLIGFGILFFTLGLGMLVRELAFANGATHTTGAVVELKKVESIDSTNLVPIVEFTPENGKPIRIECASTSPSPTVGDCVTVIYHANDLKGARIDNFVNRWLFPIVFTPIGVIAFVLGTVGAISNRQRSPNKGKQIVNRPG